MSKLRAIRNWTSRWIMRIQQASTVLQLGWWMVIGISTTILAWDFLTTMETTLLLSALIGGTLVFAYVYDRYRVLLQKQKVTSWRSNNFLGPGQKMNILYNKLLFKLTGRYIKGKLTYEEYNELLEEKTDALLDRWERQGIPKGKVDNS